MDKNLEGVVGSWKQLILNVDWEHRSVITAQLDSSVITVEENFAYIDVVFNVGPQVPLLPFGMSQGRVGRFIASAVQPDGNYICFVLFFEAGLVQFLEVSSTDSSKIDPLGIDLSNVEYDDEWQLLREGDCNG